VLERNALLLLSLLWAATMPEATLAQEPGSPPRIHGEILVELQNDWTYRSYDSANRRNALSFTIEPSLSIDLTRQVSLVAGLVLEPVVEPEPARSRWVDHEGLYVEALFLSYRNERFGLHGGKIHPNFGIAWDAAPGIYGVDFAEDYEISERIGLGGSVELGNRRIGRHTLTADVFFLDHSVLSRSWIHDRGRVRRSDGGVSNTGDLRSCSVTLQGERIPRIPGFSYHLGFAQQHAGRGGVNERSLAIGALYGLTFAKELEVELLAEYVGQHGAQGLDQRRWYFSHAASARYRGWNLALAHTLRRHRTSGASSIDDHLFQASVGYQLPIGLSFDVGWRYAREDRVVSHGLGARIAYTHAF
jgi:hypothetical protein